MRILKDNCLLTKIDPTTDLIDYFYNNNDNLLIDIQSKPVKHILKLYKYNIVNIIAPYNNKIKVGKLVFNNITINNIPLAYNIIFKISIQTYTTHFKPQHFIKITSPSILYDKLMSDTLEEITIYENEIAFKFGDLYYYNNINLHKDIIIYKLLKDLNNI